MRCFFFRAWCNLHWTDACSIRQQFRVKWFSFIFWHGFARGRTGPGETTPIHPVTSHDRFWKLSFQIRWFFVWCADKIRLFWFFLSFSHKHGDYWLLIFLIYSLRHHGNLDFFTAQLLALFDTQNSQWQETSLTVPTGRKHAVVW